MSLKTVLGLVALIVLIGSVAAYSIFYEDMNGLGFYSLTNITWVNATEDVCVGSTCLSTVSGGGVTTTTLPASNITDWPVTTPDGNIFLTMVNGSNNVARVFDPEASVYNADNITSGTLADARIASTITRDSEVPSLETDSAHDTCAEITGCVEGAITATLSESQVEAMIFDADNTADLNLNSYNVTSVTCITFASGAKVGDCG